MRLRAIRLGAARHLPVNFLGSGFGQLRHLRRYTLAVRRDSSVAKNHA
jgi:hypothetical protein